MTTARGAARLVASFFVCTLVACGSNTQPPVAKPADVPPFCQTLKSVVALMEPETGTTTPTARRVHYDRLTTLLDQAEQTAPTTLRVDIATFGRAIAAYKTALGQVGWKLEALFATPAGTKLAADTSHALSPAVIDYLTGACALAPNNGESRAP